MRWQTSTLWQATTAMATNNNSSCLIHSLPRKRMADQAIELVDWEYYITHKIATPVGCSGCQAYPKGQLPMLTGGNKADALSFTNNATQSLTFTDLPAQVFGPGVDQCDQIVSYDTTAGKGRTLLVELKYSDPRRSRDGASGFRQGLQAKYDHAVDQIDAVYRHMKSCKTCRGSLPSTFCGVVAFPRIPNVPSQSNSLRSGARTKLKTLRYTKLPQVVGANISVADLPKEYRID